MKRVELPELVAPLDPAPIPFTDEREFARARMEWHDFVMRDPRLKPTARLVGLYLCKSIGFPDATCWPSAETIADELDLSEPHVRRALSRLQVRGWVRNLGRRGFSGSNRYILTSDASVVSSIEWMLARRREARKADEPPPRVKAKPPPRPKPPAVSRWAI